VFSGVDSPGREGGVSDLIDGYEAAIAQIEHDAAFKDIEIVTHSAKRQGRNTVLTVTIDRQGGVDVGSCGRIASFINDALELVEEHYTLEVESAGLERPLLKPQDYERFAGKAARVVTTLTINGGKTHRGILRGVVGTNVVLETPQGEVPLPISTIKSANLEYDPRADLLRDKRERKNHG